MVVYNIIDGDDMEFVFETKMFSSVENVLAELNKYEDIPFVHNPKTGMLEKEGQIENYWNLYVAEYVVD